MACSSNGGLASIISFFSVIDFGFNSCPFTWSNDWASTTIIQAMLDRSLANNQWRIIYLEAVVFHLLAIHSDHKPLLVRLKGV